jgi:hypothetical protein
VRDFWKIYSLLTKSINWKRMENTGLRIHFDTRWRRVAPAILPLGIHRYQLDRKLGGPHIIKMDLKEHVCAVMDLINQAQDAVQSGSFEHGNEDLG